MKKYILLGFILTAFVTIDLNAQRIEEACEIIGTSIKDNSYKEFTIDEVRRMVLNNEINDAKSVTAFLKCDFMHLFLED